MPDPGRVLGVDYGTHRIGLALSDPDARIAFPAGVLERTSPRRDLEALCVLVREREVVRVVVGLPLHMDGRRGPEADAAAAFGRELEKASGVAVDLLDERWTTREAERALMEMGYTGRRGRRRRERVDTTAATLLLSAYLEQRGAARERGA